MGQSVPVPASELLALIENLVTHTRPATTAELIQALNFGIGKFARAIQSVRPQAFVSWVDPFVLVAGQAEYDLSIYSPTVDRPIRLTMATGSTPPITFRYQAIMGQEYEARDGRQSTPGVGFLYDILSGLMPQTPQQYSLRDGIILEFASLTPAQLQAAFPVRSIVMLPGSRADGTDLFAVVVNVIPDVPPRLILQTEPTFDSGGYGTITAQAVIPMWTRVLRLSPTPGIGYSGRLYYDYNPAQVQNGGDLIDGRIAKYRDGVVEYAVAMLLKATADTMHRDALEQANEMRAEAMQDSEPLSGQNTEAVGSALGDD